MNASANYKGPAFLSYGFRPFFFSAAIFAGIAVPIWVMINSGRVGVEWHDVSRYWHIHEMVFGFLPCVIAGFLLTAMPNWTERPPVRDKPLLGLLLLWLAGRLVMALPGFPPLVGALVDGAFLVVLAGIVWWEIVAGKAWDRSPIGVLISLYAVGNLLFHARFLDDAATNVAERLALALLMVLLALIGGRITPSFTEDFLEEAKLSQRPAAFGPLDGISILLLVIGGVAWIIQPQAIVTGWLLAGAGVTHLVRLMRWYGWLTWREPLVLILHVGYGWLAMSMLILGIAILGVGLYPEDAIHALTTGAVGAMTLAVMTRASLGHTGRPKHAGTMTVMIYVLVNLGAVFRVFGPSFSLPITMMLGLAALCWSGAYILFAVGYGPMLFANSLDEE
ncbi:MAG: NnrS family protein [Nitrospirales bacterium]|nr:NnrS family protein [Nitrospirales bacterium]